jgi:hypothetical protein
LYIWDFLWDIYLKRNVCTHRGVDFSKSGFGPRTIILCDQVCTLVLMSLQNLLWHRVYFFFLLLWFSDWCTYELSTYGFVLFYWANLTLPPLLLQCEKEYHVGCLRDHKMAFLKVCSCCPTFIYGYISLGTNFSFVVWTCMWPITGIARR